jgi:hypothetical protein
MLSLSINAALAAKPDKGAAAPVVAAEKTGKAGKADEKAEKKAEKKARKKAEKAERKARQSGVRAEPQDPTTALAAQTEHTEFLLENTKVVGTGVSWRTDGTPVIKIFVNAKPKKGEFPASLEEIPVVVSHVGNIYALNVPCEERTGKARCPDELMTEALENEDPRAPQARPVPIGVSAGSAEMAATLGCHVSRGCHNYALTNSHVAPGPGTEALLQPAAYDGGSGDYDSIASWFEAVPVVLGRGPEYANRVDAAIFAIDADGVGTSTPASGYGEPRTETVAPALNMNVMKYGRSSMQTNGYIDTINATVIVRYPTGEARFVEQLIINSDVKNGAFSLPGDSGSLVVADGGDNDRKPAGLLFASAHGISIANPINEVLFQLNIDIDGAQQ